jgi:hypothetical protein
MYSRSTKFKWPVVLWEASKSCKQLTHRFALSCHLFFSHYLSFVFSIFSRPSLSLSLISLYLSISIPLSLSPSLLSLYYYCSDCSLCSYESHTLLELHSLFSTATTLTNPTAPLRCCCAPYDLCSCLPPPLPPPSPLFHYCRCSFHPPCALLAAPFLPSVQCDSTRSPLTPRTHLAATRTTNLQSSSPTSTSR